ncbi:unnamed protein product [Prunus brigantina]
MNGFSLQSTTTPRKASKGIESFWFGVGPFERGLEFSIYRRSPGGLIEAEKICLMA